ncbi:hypothetical protein PTKIN_Ptkin10aG0015100 [Pterospermum kingtungense]
MGQKVAVISICSVFLVAMVVAVAVGVNRNNGGGGSGGISTSTKAVQAICQPTDYKEACQQSLKNANSSDPKELIKVGFQATITEIEKVIANSDTLKDAAKDPMTSQALDICKEVMDFAIDDFKRSMDQMGAFDATKTGELINNIKVWLSGAIAYEQTCLDGFENTTGEAGQKMQEIMKSSQQLTSNALAMVSEIASIFKNLNIPNVSQGIDTTGAERKLLSSDDGFPSWVSPGQRRLLAETPATIKPNVVVAKDGSGKYSTIQQALNEVPKKNTAPFVIYIKAGIYNEQVTVDKHKENVVFIGDGPTKTRITGRKNYAEGTKTYHSATVGFDAMNFMAKDIGFENSAGPMKHQAVALRVTGDKALFYNCHMDGYQDTLYAHSHRQFYRDCTITGTIDFIFGDAAAVFQNCQLIVRKPMDNQACMVTAQGKSENREVSGTVIQNCTITGAPDFPKGKIKAYLGRPWKELSKTIIMQSQIDDLIVPEGWSPWNNTDFGLNTCYYAEYGNRGPGADQSKRVKWGGIKKITAAEAQSFTAGVLLFGAEWIPKYNVPYVPGMIQGL